ncbi:Sialoadhesin [Merluccius polli]|uniref:Sialoadhesin n=1 Tax=Merluccius polli TaxID=89951 RepID=A0AA47NT20_MERPO|nr:Sialoadhesin [Merluccius polli]
MALFLIYFSGLQGNSCTRVSYPTRTMCVLQGTSVNISCTYSHPPDATLNSTYWFKWRANQEPSDLQSDSEYEGRAEYPVEETGRSTLRITDLRVTDSAEYRFTFKTSHYKWKSILHGTTLTVTGLRVEVTPVATVTEGQRVTLTCITSCPLADKPSYIWYQNNGPVTGSENPKNQLVLDPVGLQHAGNYSCSVRNYPHLRSPEETLTPPSLHVSCDHAFHQLNLCVLFILNEMCLFFTALQGNDDWTVTCTSSNVCSVRGSTVDISCTFKYPEKQHDLSTTVLETLWFTKEDRNQKPVDLLSDADYTGRVESSCGEISCIGSSCNRKCTLSIRDLRQSDSAVYNFRFKTNQPDLQVKVSPRDDRTRNLECDSMCVNPPIIWYWNGRYYGQGRSIMVYFDSIYSYSCAVKGYERLHSPSVCKSTPSLSTATHEEVNNFRQYPTSSMFFHSHHISAV